MYAIIRAGGKQHKVAPGDVIEIERVKDGTDAIEFTPLLVVDESGTTRSDKDELASARVLGKVLGEVKGPKVEVNKFRNKTGYRRHAGHRQKYSTIQIDGIKMSAGRKKAAPPAPTDTEQPAGSAGHQDLEGSSDGA